MVCSIDVLVNQWFVLHRAYHSVHSTIMHFPRSWMQYIPVLKSDPFIYICRRIQSFILISKPTHTLCFFILIFNSVIWIRILLTLFGGSGASGYGNFKLWQKYYIIKLISYFFPGNYICILYSRELLKNCKKEWFEILT